MRFSPNGKQLAIALHNGKLIITDSEVYETVTEIQCFDEDPILNLDWTTDSSVLRVSSNQH